MSTCGLLARGMARGAVGDPSRQLIRLPTEGIRQQQTLSGAIAFLNLRQDDTCSNRGDPITRDHFPLQRRVWIVFTAWMMEWTGGSRSSSDRIGVLTPPRFELGLRGRSPRVLARAASKRVDLGVINSKTSQPKSTRCSHELQIFSGII